MADDDGFISLPPGLADPDSGTHRRPRPERTERIPQEEIVFVPVKPGVAPVLPPAQPVEAPKTPLKPAAEPPELAKKAASANAPDPALTAPMPPPPLLDDGETRVSVPRHGKPSWRLTIPGIALPVTLDGVLFLGRNPAATPEFPGARVLAVTDPRKSISKTHALLEVDAGQLWVHDLDSTNGVWVVPAGQDAIEVVPGTRAAVPAGADLELGDVIIQVERS